MRPLSSRSYPGGSDTVSYGYDAAGNLLLKDDYAQSFKYSSNKPNAVTAIKSRRSASRSAIGSRVRSITGRGRLLQS